MYGSIYYDGGGWLTRYLGRYLGRHLARFLGVGIRGVACIHLWPAAAVVISNLPTCDIHRTDHKVTTYSSRRHFQIACCPIIVVHTRSVKN